MKISAFGHCWVLRWPWVLAVLAVVVAVAAVALIVVVLGSGLR